MKNQEIETPSLTTDETVDENETLRRNNVENILECPTVFGDYARPDDSAPVRISLFGNRSYHTGSHKRVKAQELTEIGNYQMIAKLGSGGMGDVFKAYDTLLGRHVAVKLIRDENSDAVKRFLREAQVQARVVHENVCKIYEVAEIDGKPFIAMQYIEGETLKNVAARLTLTEKIQVMIKASEAVHEAHKQGLIHRDIKPDNIMVEQQETGEWKPYVVDFGIAREQTSAGVTLTGVVMGTPQYMSPEQARGEVHNLSACADVYSLGATLYWLLTNKPLFAGTGLAEILFNVISTDVVTLRKLAPELPPDLETIVMKCLEKEPSRRYESARAFADDLRALLAGDPISARPLTRGQRLVRKAYKHRTITITILLAAILVLVMGSMGIYASWTSAEQAALAQQLGEEIERIDSVIRQAHLMPIHDLAAEKEVVAARLKLIEELMRKRGQAGFGPGHYAIGRALLIQGRNNEALDHLQQCWQSGYQKSEVAYWLGRALGAVYQQEIQRVEEIANKENRELRRKEVTEQYRDPARHFLQLGSGEGAALYGEALIAFYENRLPEALEKTTAAYQQMPWLYEAKSLQGDVYITLGNEALRSGNYQQARIEYQRAGEVYRTVLNVGRSDASLFKSECDRFTNLMRITPERSNDLKSYLDAGCLACEQATIIDPSDAEPYHKKANLYYIWANYQLYQNEDPHPNLERSIEMARMALEKKPDEDRAYQTIANIYLKMGEYELRRGQDPRATFQKGIESVQQSLELRPEADYSYSTLGSIYWRYGSYEMEHGLDPHPTMQKAIDACEKALRLKPQNYSPYNTIGAIMTDLGDYEAEQGGSLLPAYTRGIESFQKLLVSNPNAHVTLYNLASVYGVIGNYQAEHGEDARESYQKGLDYALRSLKIDPTYALNNAGELYSFIGKYQFEHGEDAREALRKSIDYDRRSIEAYPTYPYTYINVSLSSRLLWEYQFKQGQEEPELLAQALESCQLAIKVNSEYTPAYDELASLYLQMAKYHRLPKGSRLATILDQARAAIDRSIQIKPATTPSRLALLKQITEAQAEIKEKK